MIEAAKLEAIRGDDSNLLEEDSNRSSLERAETAAEVLASETLNGITGISSSLLSSSLLSSSSPVDPALQSAQSLISDLQHQLSIEKAHYRKKSKQWHLENSQLRVEKEMLKVSARAGDALISNLSSAVQSKRLLSNDSNNNSGQDEQLTELLSKNERLERQMADMKQVWNSYLDLIAENQKLAAVKKEKREKEREKEREKMERERILFSDPAAHLTRGPKIVKPVRAGDNRFFSPLKIAVPVGASPLATNNNSTVTTPKNHLSSNNNNNNNEIIQTPNTNNENNNNNTTPPNPAVTSSILSTLLDSNPSLLQQSQANFHSTPSTNNSTNHSRTPSSTPPFNSQTNHHSNINNEDGRLSIINNSLSGASAHPLNSLASSLLSAPALVSRSSLEHVIKRGFLSKKQMGWSLSMNKAWRKRYFLLRTMSLDYYDAAAGINTENQENNNNNNNDSNNSSSSSSSLLTGSLRGTIPIDSTTSIRVIDFSDVPFGFEIVTRDKEAKLHASSLIERDEWIAEIKSQVHKIRKSAGMRDEEIARLMQIQDKQDQIDSEHPTRAVEL